MQTSPTKIPAGQNEKARRQGAGGFFGSTRGCGLVAQFALLGYLATVFSALVGGSVDVDVPLARHQIGRLLIGECRRTLERALLGAGNRHDHGAVLAGFAGMEVSRCRGS